MPADDVSGRKPRCGPPVVMGLGAPDEAETPQCRTGSHADAQCRIGTQNVQGGSCQNGITNTGNGECRTGSMNTGAEGCAVGNYP